MHGDVVIGGGIGVVPGYLVSVVPAVHPVPDDLLPGAQPYSTGDACARKEVVVAGHR